MNDFKIVKIDETEFFSLKEGQKIFAYYLYNKNQVTYLCKLRPSYLLIFLYFSTNFDLTDKEHDEIMDVFNEEPKQYMHCSEFDKLNDAGEYQDPENAIDVSEYCDPDYSEEENEEYLIEHFRGNPNEF
jgi:hypothetical protein